MKLKTLTLTLELSQSKFCESTRCSIWYTDKPIKEDASKLRGFFASKFTEYALLHQHDVGKLIYRYPKIQYKMIDGVPLVLGIGEGADVLKEIYDKYDEIRLDENTYNVVGRGITLKEVDFGLCDGIYSYSFITPWIALSQKNYEKYWKSDRVGQRELLRRTLIGNILSASKGLDYTVPDEIKLDIVGRVTPKKCFIKKTPLVGFGCDFMVNFNIPDLIGLGKSVSRGFGAVRIV